MSDNKSLNGLGFGTILFLIFMTLKLTNFINWSWWQVTSPLWIPILVLGLIVLIAYITSK